MNNNGETMENVWKSSKTKFIKSMIMKKYIKPQSKLTFNGTHKRDTNYDSYTLKQNEVHMDKKSYLGFAVLELSSLLNCETFYDNCQS